ncbi:MAG: MBL fold metallo-hydrolase [candidate division FCPU426 bacterium]
MEISFNENGIYLPEIKLWLDAHKPMPGEAGFVSHGHADHAKWHGLTLASGPTLRFMRARQTLGTPDETRACAFETRFRHEGAMLTLLPAGHIAGSAQLLVEYKKERLIYSGDFKLRPDPACEAPVIEEAGQLIMETTFGTPDYLFPPASQTQAKIADFCKKAIRTGQIPCLLAYSLGKAQELMMALKPWGFEFLVHPSIADMCEIYKSLGYPLPAYHAAGNQSPDGRVLIWPPQGRNHSMFLGWKDRVRTAFISGWAVDESAKFKYGVDEAFPISDHADFSELLAYVWQVNPSEIYTHHGFAAEFASNLRVSGRDAKALGQIEQLELI